MVNLVQWSMATMAELAHQSRFGYSGLPNQQPKGDDYEVRDRCESGCCGSVVGLAGCPDLKPLQAQVEDLKAQVSKVQSDLSSAKSAADSANSAAQSASQAASGAQSTANQALAAAQASQTCCDATNEKIDRMFRRSVSK